MICKHCVVSNLNITSVTCKVIRRHCRIANGAAAFVLESPYLHSTFPRSHRTSGIVVATISSPHLTVILAISTRCVFVANAYIDASQKHFAVTTRTTSFTSIPHPCFYLRFSDLRETELDCQEDEEQRAVRTIDWISARINKRCTRWVEEIDKLGDEENLRTPWWDEVKKCVEGDYVPSKTEGWNHPVAGMFSGIYSSLNATKSLHVVILAVSTTAPNPLQAITALHSRNFEFPSWVDPVFLRYTLIVHPENSPLSDEE